MQKQKAPLADGNFLSSRAGSVSSISHVNPPKSVAIFSPAKINLFLAVTGRRDDGYHDLVSLVAPLDLGDLLNADTEAHAAESGKQFSLECGNPEVPADDSNLILRAAKAFALRTGWKEGVAFHLTKRIPIGAGLGGGSSNATAAIKALNQLSGANLGNQELGALAAGIGSDCPLFLEGGPVIMRGRGERIEVLRGPAAHRLRGQAVLVFKPSFGVSTEWAYRQIAVGAPQSYLPAPEAERRLSILIDGSSDLGGALLNNLEPVVFRKFVALPALLDQLRSRFGLTPRMSGSGSACFALLPPDAPRPEIIGAIRESWGEACFVQIAAIA